MQINITDIQTTSITTVRAIEIIFSKEGEEYTAEFTSTSNYDANTDHTQYDMQIINQLALPALTDEEEKELWDKAHELAQAELQNNDSETHAAIMAIDWKLLREQKEGVLSTVQGGLYNPEEDEYKSGEGILSLIDSLQDAVVADGLFTEETVFGAKEPEEVNIRWRIDTPTPTVEKGKYYLITGLSESSSWYDKWAAGLFVNGVICKENTDGLISFSLIKPIVIYDADVEFIMFDFYVTTKEIQEKAIKSNITSFDEFLKIPLGSIMSTGVITDPRLHHSEVRWIAKKGDGFDDWAIYYHYSTYPTEYIKRNGDKCTTEAVIRMLFPCDDAVYARYRK